MAILDKFLTKSLATSGTSAQYPTGVIADGGSAVDEFDHGKSPTNQKWYVWFNVSAVGGTSPTMTPKYETDDAVTFGSVTNRWTCPVAIAAVGFKAFELGVIPERYGRINTGTIGGSATPELTFTCGITPYIPSGRLTV